jgi:L-fuculose-phosphate aldolase
MDRAYLEEEHLVRVKSGMKELGKTPSRAVGLHQEIYDANPNIRAVLLAHPVHAMAFAVTDAKFDPRTIPESYILLRDIKRIPYGNIYTNQKETAKIFTEACPAVMVDNDCVIVTGESLLKAFDRLEVMESTAHSIINSTAIGNIVHITQEEVEDLKVAFNLKD